ncbi:hypothetical protein BVRB_035390, partial [Beta vulgaris subsp. vulgaris]
APSTVMMELLERGQGKLNSSDISLYDELSGSQDSGPLSKGFIEMPIEFPPTYKYTPFSDILIFNDRIPSFTDRILFRFVISPNEMCLNSECHPSDLQGHH